MKRVLISLASLVVAIIFVFPNLVLLIGITLAIYCKWVSGLFILILAWNIAKMVESKYIKYLEKKDGN